MNFRIVKHTHHALPGEVVKEFATHIEAVEYRAAINRNQNLYWIEGRIGGEWYGLAQGGHHETQKVCRVQIPEHKKRVSLRVYLHESV